MNQAILVHVRRTRRLLTIVAACAVFSQAALGAELSSWVSGSTRDRIVRFVENVTQEGTPNYVPPPDRVAVFDNDGTLWDEKPLPVEFYFTRDQVRRMAPSHPEWKSKQPFKAVLEGNLAYFAQLPEKEKFQQALTLLAETHSGMPMQSYKNEVLRWFQSSKDTETQRPYTERAYAPMLELLAYLRDKGFKTYIVTGGDTEFVRAISRETYGVPMEQVIGSDFQTRWENRNGEVALNRTSKL
ncbi:MAG: HAD family hydrolase, partial [Bdellovibrionia bacterium]